MEKRQELVFGRNSILAILFNFVKLEGMRGGKKMDIIDTLVTLLAAIVVIYIASFIIEKLCEIIQKKK